MRLVLRTASHIDEALDIFSREVSRQATDLRHAQECIGSAKEAVTTPPTAMVTYHQVSTDLLIGLVSSSEMLCRVPGSALGPSERFWGCHRGLTRSGEKRGVRSGRGLDRCSGMRCIRSERRKGDVTRRGVDAIAWRVKRRIYYI